MSCAPGTAPGRAAHVADRRGAAPPPRLRRAHELAYGRKSARESYRTEFDRHVAEKIASSPARGTGRETRHSFVCFGSRRRRREREPVLVRSRTWSERDGLTAALRRDREWRAALRVLLPEVRRPVAVGRVSMSPTSTAGHRCLGVLQGGITSPQEPRPSSRNAQPNEHAAVCGHRPPGSPSRGAPRTTTEGGTSRRGPTATGRRTSGSSTAQRARHSHGATRRQTVTSTTQVRERTSTAFTLTPTAAATPKQTKLCGLTTVPRAGGTAIFSAHARQTPSGTIRVRFFARYAELVGRAERGWGAAPRHVATWCGHAGSSYPERTTSRSARSPREPAHVKLNASVRDGMNGAPAADRGRVNERSHRAPDAVPSQAEAWLARHCPEGQ